MALTANTAREQRQLERALDAMRETTNDLQAVADTLPVGVAQNKVLAAVNNLTQSQAQVLKAIARLRVDDLTNEVTAVQDALTQATADFNALP